MVGWFQMYDDVNLTLAIWRMCFFFFLYVMNIVQWPNLFRYCVHANIRESGSLLFVAGNAIFLSSNSSTFIFVAEPMVASMTSPQHIFHQFRLAVTFFYPDIWVPRLHQRQWSAKQRNDINFSGEARRPFWFPNNVLWKIARIVLDVSFQYRTLI